MIWHEQARINGVLNVTKPDLVAARFNRSWAAGVEFINRNVKRIKLNSPTTMVFSSFDLLWATIALNTIKHYAVGATPARWSFSAGYHNSALFMLISMFSHVDGSHLFWNMFFLHQYGTIVFQQIKTRRNSIWHHPWAFLWVYVASGIGACIGVIWLSGRLEHQISNDVFSIWSSLFGTKDTCRDNVGLPWENATATVCTTGNDTRDLQELTQGFTNFIYHAMYHYTPRVGASGAVSGLIGARLVTAVYSEEHRPLLEDDLFTIVGYFAAELMDCPLTVSSLKFSMDGIDHTAHAFGFVAGAIATIIWLKWGELFLSVAVDEWSGAEDAIDDLLDSPNLLIIEKNSKGKQAILSSKKPN